MKIANFSQFLKTLIISGILAFSAMDASAMQEIGDPYSHAGRGGLLIQFINPDHLDSFYFSLSGFQELREEMRRGERPVTESIGSFSAVSPRSSRWFYIAETDLQKILSQADDKSSIRISAKKRGGWAFYGCDLNRPERSVNVRHNRILTIRITGETKFSYTANAATYRLLEEVPPLRFKPIVLRSPAREQEMIRTVIWNDEGARIHVIHHKVIDCDDCNDCCLCLMCCPLWALKKLVGATMQIEKYE